MRINSDLKLRRVDNKSFIVAIGETSKVFHGMVKLNDTGALVFSCLKKNYSEEKIAKRLEKTYGIGCEQAKSDTRLALELFEKAGFFV